MATLKWTNPVNFIASRQYSCRGYEQLPFMDYSIKSASSFYRKNMYGHFGCVNAVEFSLDGNYLVSGGDDRRVLLWDMTKAVSGQKVVPKLMDAEHLSNIFCLAFDAKNSKLLSAGNDEKVIVHNMATGGVLDFFTHEQPVFGISADPKNEFCFCSACDDGRILHFDLREPHPGIESPICVARQTAAFHSVMHHPQESNFILAANSKEGVALWDLRKPRKAIIKYGNNRTEHNCMNARFNGSGSQFLVLRRRLPPILYSTYSPSHLFQFDNEGYYNSCTMKSCCFAGTKDQFILAGSDNFDLCMWTVPDEYGDNQRWVKKATHVLQGHRSIVNQVRFNPHYNVIVSSGVEKIVKLWSNFPLSNYVENQSIESLASDEERKVCTHDEYIDLVLRNNGNLSASGASPTSGPSSLHRNMREDIKMLAFFDALVQRDINGVSDDENDIEMISYTNVPYPYSSGDDVIGTSGDDIIDDDNGLPTRDYIPSYSDSSSDSDSDKSSLSRSRSKKRISDSTCDKSADQETLAQTTDTKSSPDGKNIRKNILTRLILKTENHKRRLAQSKWESELPENGPSRPKRAKTWNRFSSRSQTSRRSRVRSALASTSSNATQSTAMDDEDTSSDSSDESDDNLQGNSAITSSSRRTVRVLRRNLLTETSSSSSSSSVNNSVENSSASPSSSSSNESEPEMYIETAPVTSPSPAYQSPATPDPIPAANANPELASVPPTETSRGRMIREPISIDSVIATAIAVSRDGPVFPSDQNSNLLKRKRRGRKDLRITIDTTRNDDVREEETDEESNTEGARSTAESDSDESGIGVNTSETVPTDTTTSNDDSDI